MTEPTHELSGVEAEDANPSTRISLVFSWSDGLIAHAMSEAQRLVVGRSEPADVIVAEPSLSRTHARFTVSAGRVHVEDLDSTNGVMLNGQRVREAFVQSGDGLRLGSVEVFVGGTSELGDAQQTVPHAGFLAQLARELTRASLFGRSLCLCVVSHEQPGDSERWKATLRPVDLLCHYAPTLSLILMPECDLRGAISWATATRGKAAERLAIAEYPLHAAVAGDFVGAVLEAVHAARPGGPPVHPAESGPSDLIKPVIVSRCMQQLYTLIERVARTSLPVLVLGETGSGKELAARAVHDHSPRASGPFKALNCATIPPNLIESVLFGYERGAFTGADKQTAGVFEQAQGGSVFLDEVGELSAQAQAALLRVLEQKKIVRVGGHKEIAIDVRVIAATHRNLPAMVQAGSFREDLMFRLDALTLSVPPLRDRRDEIAPLAQLFLAQVRSDWGTQVRSISPEALDVLVRYAWPGNVRQLKNVIQRAAAVTSDAIIDVDDLPAQITLTQVRPAVTNAELASPTTPSATAGFRSLPEMVREFEVALIRDALQRSGGSQAQAARMLGVPRRTLASKVHALGLIDAVEELSKH